LRLVLAILGTLGDLFPFLALGGALRARGHSVAVASAPAVSSHVRNTGLEWFPCPPGLWSRRSPDGVRGLDHWPSAGWPTLLLRERVGDLVKACRGADLLIPNSGITGERPKS
jgi:rhamnosyltransferase subunit B